MELTDKETRRVLVRRFVRRRWKLPLQIIGAALLIMMVSGYATGRKGEGVVRKPASDLVTNGVVDSLRAKSIGSEFDGQVESLSVRAGQTVKKGQKLFRMDVRPLLAELAVAKAETASAYQALQQSRAECAADLHEFNARIQMLNAAYQQERQAIRASREAVAAPVASEDEASGTIVETPSVDPYDTTRLTQLDAELREAQRLRAEQQAAWNPVIAAAAQAHRQAAGRVGQIQALIASADRRSPLNGVVTALNIAPGEWIRSHQPVLRVDDPSGYRVVTLVDSEVRARLEPGSTLTLRAAAGPSAGRLEKIEPGEDRELFKYYLWLKPQQAAGLRPGAQVDVVVAQAAGETQLTAAR